MHVPEYAYQQKNLATLHFELYGLVCFYLTNGFIDLDKTNTSYPLPRTRFFYPVLAFLV